MKKTVIQTDEKTKELENFTYGKIKISYNLQRKHKKELLEFSERFIRLWGK